MDCVIESCVRDAKEDDKIDFCIKHQIAADNIEETYAKWQVAYGEDFTYQQYLQRLMDDYEIGSGDMVIEVAEYFIDHEQ